MHRGSIVRLPNQSARIVPMDFWLRRDGCVLVGTILQSEHEPVSTHKIHSFALSALVGWFIPFFLSLFLRAAIGSPKVDRSAVPLFRFIWSLTI